MYVEITKDGVSQKVKERYLQNFLDRGWKVTGSKKNKPAVKVEATAEVKPVEDEPKWDINEEEWAESEEAMITNKGD
jgi:hypothetical protein